MKMSFKSLIAFFSLLPIQIFAQWGSGGGALDTGKMRDSIQSLAGLITDMMGGVFVW